MVAACLPHRARRGRSANRSALRRAPQPADAPRAEPHSPRSDQSISSPPVSDRAGRVSDASSHWRRTSVEWSLLTCPTSCSRRVTAGTSARSQLMTRSRMSCAAPMSLVSVTTSTWFASRPLVMPTYRPRPVVEPVARSDGSVANEVARACLGDGRPRRRCVACRRASASRSEACDLTPSRRQRVTRLGSGPSDPAETRDVR